MKVLLLTNEYPPNVYGGAGMHVDYLSRELAKLCDVDVRYFGDQRSRNGPLTVTGFPLDDTEYTCPDPLRSVFGAMQRGVDFNTAAVNAHIVHAHTWYSHLGGILAKLNYSIPLVITTHSLEPLRPWKREQLGGGYNCTVWVEKTAIEMADAVVAVSREAKNDIMRLFKVDQSKVHIIHNGIDLDEYRPTHAPERLMQLGIQPDKPYLLFVGRITRQKGIIHLVRAMRHMDTGFQIVLCAGAPDTPEIGREMDREISHMQQERGGIVWIREMLDTPTKIALYSHAGLFCCPSIYEPFGIINLEAMACETAVVASDVGGIKDVVVEGETGLLVPIEGSGTAPFEPASADRFERAIAEKVNRLMKDPQLCAKMGTAGRKRAIEHFSWSAIAAKTFDLYKSLS